MVPVGPDNGTWQGGPGDANGGPIQIGPDGGNGSWQSVTVGPDGGTYVQGGSGQVGGRGQYGGRGGVIQVMPYGKGGMM